MPSIGIFVTIFSLLHFLKPFLAAERALGDRPRFYAVLAVKVLAYLISVRLKEDRVAGFAFVNHVNYDLPAFRIISDRPYVRPTMDAIRAISILRSTSASAGSFDK